jgi:hypothetical protein
MPQLTVQDKQRIAARIRGRNLATPIIELIYDAQKMVQQDKIQHDEVPSEEEKITIESLWLTIRDEALKHYPLTPPQHKPHNTIRTLKLTPKTQEQCKQFEKMVIPYGKWEWHTVGFVMETDQAWLEWLAWSPQDDFKRQLCEYLLGLEVHEVQVETEPYIDPDVEAKQYP